MTLPPPLEDIWESPDWWSPDLDSPWFEPHTEADSYSLSPKDRRSRESSSDFVGTVITTTLIKRKCESERECKRECKRKRRSIHLT